MTVAVIGSRNLTIHNLEKYLPPQTTELVSGGAKGIDSCAKAYADKHQLPITEFLPAYHRYGKGAPLRRNLEIISYADFLLIFWDGKSSGTKFTIEQCKRQRKPHMVYLMAEPH